ncbi:mucolipin-1-like [Ruditapes philippinarum]|uniref:mucolipin-1-like n=1 Tax=Ruditapes philippinarum TaxID=129788 RepID=UPI00295C12A3|nr:mucolipin-1-like [Ruditapes philippinarum]
MSTAAETLFSMSQGDEIFATFAILQDEYAGDKTVHLFLRVVIYAYVSLFTILIFNLLIALFNSAYEVVKDKNKQSNNLSTAGQELWSAGDMVSQNNMETLRDILVGDQDSVNACKWKPLFGIFFPIYSWSKTKN